MAMADPLLAITLTRLPGPEEQLAALGVVKAVAVFLESPIIMVLHASTALSGWAPSRRALGRFVALLTLVLTVILLILVLPPVFHWLMNELYDLDAPVARAAWLPLLLMCLWPAVIGWRRFHQGQLILQGRGHFMGMASMFRVLGLALVLLLGSRLRWPGATLGAVALMTSLLLEAFLVVFWCRGGDLASQEPATALPSDLASVARYYAPLALTMMLMWGGRAALLAILARAEDHELALAAWSASWGFVILIANLTRMVQQLVIKYARQVPVSRLLALGLWAGGLGCLMLAMLGHTSPGKALLQLLIGRDSALGAAGQSVVALSLALPVLVGLQNVLQGYCIVGGKNRWVNAAGLVSVGFTLVLAYVGVRLGFAGASVGAISLCLGLSIEVGVLAALRPWSRLEATG